MRVVLQIQEELRRAVANAIAAAGAAGELTGEGTLPEINLEVPREKEHGDFATNIAMIMAKSERKPPRQVAQIILDNLVTDGTWIEGAELAGPGFINFRLKPGWLHQALPAILKEGEGFGRTEHGGGQRILLEFVSANPTGPLVIVNARAAALGSALANLLNAAGYECRTEFYVNDAGNQVHILSQVLDFRIRELLDDPTATMPEGGYPGEYMIECARQWLHDHSVTTLEQYNTMKAAAPATARRSAGEPAFLDTLARWGTEYFRSSQETILGRYGVVFDRWFSERSLHEQNWPARAVERLRELGQVYDKDGAVWMRSSNFGDDKDRVLIKSDGNYTYVAPDIAYHWNKFDRGFTKLIDILGQDHHGYQGRMMAALRCLGYPEGALEVLITQMVRVLRAGELVRMSKRKGNFVEMQDLLDEVSVDAARFFFLMRSPDTQMDFDLDLANLKSNENPVFYVQYAHARIKSLLSKAEEAGLKPEVAGARLELLTDESELTLTRRLADLPEEIIGAADAREPQRITRYVHEVATAFHSFYTRCHVITEDKALSTARLALAAATASVLKTALGLLGVSAPERM